MIPGYKIMYRNTYKNGSMGRDCLSVLACNLVHHRDRDGVATVVVRQGPLYLTTRDVIIDWEPVGGGK